MKCTYKDISNQKFNRLTAIEYAGTTANKLAIWLCKCDCGNYITVRGSHLRNGNTKSCGCYKMDELLKRVVKHGYSRVKSETAEYRTFKAMHTRCYNKKAKVYKNHGARGIIVCDRWYRNFNNFIADMGSKPSH